MADVYCTSSGAGTHSGASVANAYSWAELITAINDSTVANGDLCRICGDIDHGGTGQTITRNAASTGYITLRGYDSGGTTIGLSNIGSASTIAGDVLTISGTYYATEYLKFSDTAKSAGQDGLNITVDYQRVLMCEAEDCHDGFQMAGSRWTTVYGCVALNCAGYGFQNSNDRCEISNCYAENCTTGGFHFSNSAVFNCIAANGGVGFTGNWTHNCTAYTCTGNGFNRSSTGYNFLSANSTAIDCSGYGWSGAGTGGRSILFNCADYSNTSGRVTNNTYDLNSVTLTSDPFVDGANGDFTPNNTAGGGADLRAAQVSPTGLTNYRDIGPGQHEDPAGGGLIKSRDLSGGMG